MRGGKKSARVAKTHPPALLACPLRPFFDSMSALSTSARSFVAQGARPTQEDRVVIWEGSLYQRPVAVYAVADGHNGTISVQLCREQLVPLIFSHSNFQTASVDVQAVLRDVVSQLELNVIQATREEKSVDGCTLLVVLVWEHVLYIANVGDCRAVLVRREHEKMVVRQLTTDHRVADEKEKNRLIQAGGVVRRNRLVGVTRDLEVSRAIGDREFKEGAVAKALSAEPEIVRYELEKQDVMLLVATDGLWGSGFLEMEDVARSALEQMEKGGIAKAVQSVVMEVQSFWDRDNCACILVRVNGDEEEEKKEAVRADDAEVSQEGRPDIEGAVCDYWEASRNGVTKTKGLMKSAHKRFLQRKPK